MAVQLHFAGAGMLFLVLSDETVLLVEIVERNSGTIESENEPIEIDVDHSRLNKCRSRDSRLYRALHCHPQGCRLLEVAPPHEQIER
jgi:hypothetical protein